MKRSVGDTSIRCDEMNAGVSIGATLRRTTGVPRDESVNCAMRF